MKRQPPPERERDNLEVQVTFRLTRSEAAALRALADEFEIGHATLCRRIVQQYLTQQPKPKRRT